MNGMLLHLDEELTNNRPGHNYGTRYEPVDLAFWIQFYSLFYDQVLVPANFLTDSNLIPDVLRILRVQEPASLLRLDNGPFQIVWDEVRFPYPNFDAMVRDIESGNVSDVGLREISRSKLTAAVCDKYLSPRVLRLPTERGITADNDASIRLLREELFSPQVNSALSSSACQRLQDCLQRIEDRGGPIGYGRNFFYTVFGYGRASKDLETARAFYDIAGQIGDLQHPFLTAVDYASHMVKAQLAGAGLKADVAAVLPSEYQRVFRRAHTDRIWHYEDATPVNDALSLREKHTYLLDRDRIIGMTPEQFTAIRSGGEYEHLRTVVDAVAAADRDPQMAQTEDLSAALDSYLRRIESVLNPGRYYTDRAFGIAGRVHLSNRGMAVLCALGTAGAMVASEPMKSLFTWGVELLTVHYGVGMGSEWAREKITRRKEFRTEGFQLGRDIRVQLLKMRSSQ